MLTTLARFDILEVRTILLLREMSGSLLHHVLQDVMTK
jgi:hypothetical protein